MIINLNGNWQLRSEELHEGKDAAAIVMGKTENWLNIEIPGDIREPLIQYGVIKEPLNGMNNFDSEWVENKSWWFKKTFTILEEMLCDDTVELVAEGLDIGANLFVNGTHIGYHPSAFYEFRKNIKKYIHAGENQLMIRLTTGLERIDTNDLEPYQISTEEERRPGRGDARRAFLRKPQYSFGWDWGPKVSTCCIAGNVWIESHRQAVIRDVRTWTKEAGRDAVIGVTVEVDLLHAFKTAEAELSIEVVLEGKVKACTTKDLWLLSGINCVDFEIPIQEARLWWPSGMGEQPLYTLHVSMKVAGEVFQYPALDFGIRTIVIDHHKISADERLFAITINGIHTFCKGANWIPADSVYARVREERYRILLEEAKEANFNMLRIW